MSKEIVKQDIIQILQSVIEQTETINGYEGRIPQIEIDLIQENIRQLYQNYYYLNKLNKNEVDSQPEETVAEDSRKADQKASQEKEQAEAVEQKEKEIDAKSDNKNASVPDSETEATKATKKATHEPQQTAEQPEKVKPNEEQDLFSRKSSTLADKLQNNSTKSSLYDHISKKESGTLEDRLKKKPVSDIKTAIGINEKFLFINELFKGNMHDYNNAIKQLNRASGMEEAAQLFDQLKEQYGWDPDGEVTLQLLDFVERKYS